VAAKDELLMLMVDAALGAPPERAEAGVAQSWRDGLTQWSVGLRRAYHRNPWALRVPITAPPLGPNNVAWLDNALGCLSDTDLTEQEKLSTVLLLSGFVRNEATLSADFAAGSSGQPQMPGYGATLSRLIDPGAFPALHRAIVSGSLDDPDDPDSEFNFGLLRILDGVAVLVQTKP
jgi:Tetracyclin repressor-like, C-terminal domain